MLGPCHKKRSTTNAVLTVVASHLFIYLQIGKYCTALDWQVLHGINNTITQNVAEWRFPDSNWKMQPGRK